MVFCHQCGYQLTLGIEKFCPNCGTDLQKQKTTAIGGGRMTDDNNNSIGIQHTGGDVFGTGTSGSGNITAKDTKGNIFYFNIGGISSEQLKSIITSSTTLDTSQFLSTDNNTNAKNLQKVTETKQQTGQVLEEINRIEREEGKEIQEIKVGDLQISRKELSLKEIILKGNEYYYNKEYEESIEWYDKSIQLDPNNLEVWFNKGYALDKLGKYVEAIECYDKAIKIDPNYADALNNKGVALGNLGKYKEAIEYYDKALEIDPKYADALNNKDTALKLIDKSERRK